MCWDNSSGEEERVTTLSLTKLEKKRLGSRTTKNEYNTDLYKYTRCSCPKDDWEVIIVDHDEYFNDRSTIYHHCDDCGENLLILDFETDEVLYSIEY